VQRVHVTSLVSIEAIRDAAARIAGVARRTPLIEVGGAGIRPAFAVKCENMQPAGAFKIRGAYNMLAQLSPEARAAGVITYSSGNHGQAMALAARLLGARAVVVMPETAPRVKIAGAERHGAEVLFAGTTMLDRKARAESEAAARGLTMVPPFDHAWIIAGQGTCGLEIVEQSPILSPGRADHRRRAGGRGEDERVARRRAPGHAGDDGKHRRRAHAGASRRSHLCARAGVC
jgi:threonine dehydratase